ncbi:chemotaxis protein CheW [Stutzerimonas zhaodongensis]|uniref:chemotaxis protein CheW n=1 Tax=Stutzerimonas TaxID=2901164 RepID=UPI0038904D1A
MTYSSADSGQASNLLSEQYLTFQISGETYAVNSLCVREIIEFPLLTRVPMVGTTIKGVINLRGSVVPVVDLAARFGIGRTSVSRRTCIVILDVLDEDGSHVLGVSVDAVSEVLEIDPSDICQAPAFGSRIRTEFIRGMTKVGERFVTLLAIPQVLATGELAASG